MALLVVLAVISVLVVSGIELARRTGQSAMASGQEADRFMAKEQAMAGLHLAMAILVEDAATTEVDSLQEDWAIPEKLSIAVEAMGVEPDNLVLEISDELGKLQVNALIKDHPGRESNPDHYQIWERFFDPMAEDEQALVNCLQDWIDTRDDEAVTGISGAESNYYLSLDPPYTCTNGPFTHISELFLVKGITRSLFDGTTINSEDIEVKPENHTGSSNLVPEELITVHGLLTDDSAQEKYQFSGRVNINTAPEAVLRALLPEEAQDFARDLVSYRVEQSDDSHFFTNTLDKGWVKQVIELPQKQKQAFDRIIRYDSTLFRVRVQSKVNHAQIRISGLVLREQDSLSGKWSCRLTQVVEDT